MKKKVVIIAEAGVNHNGSLETAMKLIQTAAKAGADIVKFQTFRAEKLVSRQAVKASYQVANTGNAESQFEMLTKLELNREDHLKLIEFCKEQNIEFLSTPFDIESIGLLKELGIRKGKIPSGEITNLPFLRTMAVTFDEIILSTGMSTMEEISSALSVLTESGMKKDQITVLHCNTEYPTPFEDVNLLAMDTISREFGVNVGYSDHTLGFEIPVAAVALGASMIEKHFTLDHLMEGPDHKASLEPVDLYKMVSAIRNIELALGSERKFPSPSELKNKMVARKSIVASSPIRKGETFSKENLTVKRPGNGISPMEWDKVIGLIAKKDFQMDEIIEI